MLAPFFSSSTRSTSDNTFDILLLFAPGPLIPQSSEVRTSHQEATKTYAPHLPSNPLSKHAERCLSDWRRPKGLLCRGAMAHNYDVGTRAWQPDPTEGWLASEVEAKDVQGDKVKLVFQLANGEVGLSLFAGAITEEQGSYSYCRSQEQSKPPWPPSMTTPTHLYLL